MEQGFSESDDIFEDIYLFPSIAQYPSENIGGCLAEFREDQAELIAPIQHPFGARSQIAGLFGLEPGEVHLLKYVTVGDVGKAIQPEACKGQLDGAAVLGLGNTLYEEMVYQDGQLLNGDPLQYRLSLLHNLPAEFYSVMVENGDGPGPFGSKGMGQTAVSPVASAVANAIYEATGVRIKELPITPEKILRGLGRM